MLKYRKKDDSSAVQVNSAYRGWIVVTIEARLVGITREGTGQ